MQDHREHVTDVQEPYPSSQYNTPPPDNNGTPGTSSDKGKGKSKHNLPPPCSADNDELRVHSDLLNAWMQRLQTLTVVAAFLASMDGQLFSLTSINTHIGQSMSATARELLYCCLAGSLIFHISAAILAYIASFTLIRYRIVDASGEDDTKVRGMLLFAFGAAQSAQCLPRRLTFELVHPLGCFASLLERPDRFGLLSLARRHTQWSSPPPLSLLTRCYYTTLWFTAIGFVLALVGIMAYVWAGLRIPVGIFSTVCLGVCVTAGVWAIVM